MNPHSLPAPVLDRLAAQGFDPVERQLYARRGVHHVDLRMVDFEVRENEDGTRGLTGYATTWDTWYDVAGGAPYGWSESIAAGAATRSLAERDDVRFLVNHTGVPMARTVSQTMTLTADQVGLLVDVPSLDLRNPSVVELLSALDRRDVDQMSFAFKAIRQEWNADYTERRILELRLFDVSAVTFPANPATIIASRDAGTLDVETKGGMPYSLARALADAIA